MIKFFSLGTRNELHMETSISESVKLSQDKPPVSAESTAGEEVIKKKKSVLIDSEARTLETPHRKFFSCHLFFIHFLVLVELIRTSV